MKKRRLCGLMKVISGTPLATFLLLFTYDVGRASYSAGGDLSLSVRNNQYVHTTPPVEQVLAWDSAWITGSVPGNFARCAYLADLRGGTLGLLAEGFAPLANVYAGGEAYVNASATMSDRIRFVLPPGAYAQTPHAVLRGRLFVRMGASGSEFATEPPRHSNVQSMVQATWGSSYGSTNYTWLKFLDAVEGSYTLDRELKLSVPLLSAETTNLTVTNIVFVFVSVSTQVLGGALGMWPYGASETWFLSDGWNGVHFTSLEVPAGITWNSDSGVFMDQPEQPVGPLRIRLTEDRVNAVVSWDGPGRLQESAEITGGWQTLTSAVSPYTNAVSRAPRLYRLIFP